MVDSLHLLMFLSLMILLYVVLPGFVGAFFLRSAAKFVNRTVIPFDPAFGAMVEAIMLHLYILFTILACMHSIGVEGSVALVRLLWYLPVGILINASIIQSRLKSPFFKSLKISLLMFLMAAMLGGLIVGVVILFLRFTSPS